MSRTYIFNYAALSEHTPLLKESIEYNSGVKLPKNAIIRICIDRNNNCFIKYISANGTPIECIHEPNDAVYPIIMDQIEKLSLIKVEKPIKRIKTKVN